MTIISESALAILTLSITGVVYLWALISKQYFRRHKLPYPPGPSPKDLISGNKSDISTAFVWCKYKEWANLYGSVLYVRVFGKPIMVLNSLEDAVELLERRSHIYSSRPIVPMYDLMGFTYNTAMMPYGSEWRIHRKIFQQTFKPDAALAYRPTQTKKMHDMLYGLLTTPNEFRAHIHTLAGAIILSVMYGYNVAPKDDHLVTLVESTVAAFSHGASYEWKVNNFPILRFIPSWFPFAGFKRYANSVRRQVVKRREVPFGYALNSVTTGIIHKPVVSSLIDSCKSDHDIMLLQEAASAGYGAGVGTTVFSTIVFLIAMIQFPEVQKKAQEEIERVVGSDRLPDYGDQSSLPYTQAIVREVFRWKPIVPLGIAHLSTKDDVYNGYYIPKDSTIHPNVWAMTRDPAKYEDPERFNPDRFFNEAGQLNNDDMAYVFGFGRRICPGRHLAIASVWLAVATVLATFTIGNKKDEAGNDVPLDVKFTVSGVSSFPLPFECSITPRSEKAKRLILEARERD